MGVGSYGRSGASKGFRLALVLRASSVSSRQHLKMYLLKEKGIVTLLSRPPTRRWLVCKIKSKEAQVFFVRDNFQKDKL